MKVLRKGRRWKCGKVGADDDAHRSVRAEGCDCCPQSASIWHVNCDGNRNRLFASDHCPYHGPLIVKHLREELAKVRAAIKLLLPEAG